jgi:PAS domain S-box-containing protein
VKPHIGKKIGHLWSLWEQHFIPPYAWESDPLTLWRERILFALLFIAFVLGPFALIPSLILAFSEGLVSVFLLDLGAYAAVAVLLFSRHLSIQIRTWTFGLILYALGIGLLVILGTLGAGYIWLFGASVLMATILGFRTALWSLVLNTLTLAAVAVFIAYGEPPWAQSIENALSKWIVMAVNFLLLNAIVTITTALMLADLKKALAKEKKTSLALGQSEARYRTLFEHAPLGIITIDGAGRIIDVNSKLLEILGSPSKEATQQISILDFPPAVQADFAKQLQDALQQGRTQSYETSYTSKWGKTLHLRYHLRPLPASQSIDPTALGIVEDITREKHQEEKLRQAQKMEAMGLLAGGVAHDLNNILSGIVSYPELLLFDLAQDSPLREPLLAIKESGEKAAEIVQDLLTLARRGVAAKKVTDLNHIITDFLKSPAYRKLLSNHAKVRVQTNLCPGILNISGSEVHLSKSLMNLVSNAADAMPGGGDITITTDNRYIDNAYQGFERIPEGEYTIVEVRDAGIGMLQSDLARIFDPFYTKKAMGRSGTGLGMSVVWGTLRDHDGFIDIHTEEGRGTAFELYFPVTRLEKQTAGAVYIEDYLGKGESILVVDDSPEQRALAERMLQRLGYDVSAVSSGEKALAATRKEPYDLLVLDMIMPPGWDGLETYQAILEHRPHQKAIIASGYSETERVQVMQQIGAGEYVKKPYTLEKIGLAVRKELDRPSNDHQPIAAS